MNLSNIFLGISNIILGLLIASISYPLIKRKVKMNKWYGIRVPKAYESEENWYKINEYGGKKLLLGGVAIALTGPVLFLLPAIKNELVLIVGFIPLFVIVPIAVMILVYTEGVK